MLRFFQGRILEGVESTATNRVPCAHCARSDDLYVSAERYQKGIVEDHGH